MRRGPVEPTRNAGFFVPNVFWNSPAKRWRCWRCLGFFFTKVKPKFGGTSSYWRKFSTSKTRYCSLSHSFNFPLSFCTSQAMLTRFLKQQWFKWKLGIANKKKDPQLWQSGKWSQFWWRTEMSPKFRYFVWSSMVWVWVNVYFFKVFALVPPKWGVLRFLFGLPCQTWSFFCMKVYIYIHICLGGCFSFGEIFQVHFFPKGQLSYTS